MQVLYVVEFDVGATEDPSAYDRLVQHLADWLNRGASALITVDDLATSGSATLPMLTVRGNRVADRTASWEHVNGTVRALRLSVTQGVDKTVELTTRVTIAKGLPGVRLRVGMSREQSSGSLSPIGETPLFQPGLVETVARDESLSLHIGQQQVDSQYIPVRTVSEAYELAQVMRTGQRLPVLLVHLRSPASWDVAKKAANKLIGLTRVCTLNYATSRALAHEVPQADVPFGGARLIWSDVDTPGPVFTPDAIEHLGGEGVRKQLMWRVAALSALARGVDSGWRAARVGFQAQSLATAETLLQQARADSDVTAELEAMKLKVDQLEVQVREWQELSELSEAEAKSLEARAARADLAEQSAIYWREQYEASVAQPSREQTDPWENVPVLRPREDPEPTFLALEDASEGRIVFTDGARRSWKNIAYPDPADMTEKLLSLARAAVRLYAHDGDIATRIDDWFMTEFQLRVAMSDETISKRKRLRYFTYDGLEYDQLPHVKVRDGVKPNEVGRIHFSLDPKEGRLIVNHVALKLYGI